MSAAILTPPSVLLASVPPNPRVWTVEDFRQLWSLGLFEGRRAFLLNGVIWEQGPMNAPHANGVERADTAIRGAFGTGWRYRIQLPLELGQLTNPMPDVAVIAGQLTGDAEHPSVAALVIEVADTTLTVDTTEKAEAYATAGIAEYWVLDVTNRVLIVFRDPAALPVNLNAIAYRTRFTVAPGDHLSPLAAPHASIAVADLLP